MLEVNASFKRSDEPVEEAVIEQQEASAANAKRDTRINIPPNISVL